MYKYNLLIILLLITNCITAQNSAFVKGKIVDEKNSPLEFVNISIDGESRGEVSDANGFYSIEISANKKVVLLYSFLGYTTDSISVYLSANQQITKNIVLKSSSQEIGTVTVVRKRDREENITRLNPRLVSNLASASLGGIENVLKTLPGVHSQSELSSQYSVRGGSFDENLVFVNNIQIYRPGLIKTGQQEGLSFVNPKLVSSLTFSSGGYEAKYGDKMSSVLDITYKKPHNFEASVDMSFLGADVHIGGTAFGKRLSHITGVRYRNTGFLLKSLDESGDYKPSFGDVQTYWTLNATENLTFSVLGYFAQNKYEFVPDKRETTFGSLMQAYKMNIYYEGKEIDQSRTYMGALSSVWRPNEFLKLAFDASIFKIDEKETYDIESEYWLNQMEISTEYKNDSVANLSSGNDMRHARNFLWSDIFSLQHNGSYITENNSFLWGVNYRYESFEHNIDEWKLIDSAYYTLPANENDLILKDVIRANLTHSNNKLGFYLNDYYRFSKCGIAMGMRYDYIENLAEHQFSPRLRLSWKTESTADVVYRFSTGLFYQSPQFREMITTDGRFIDNINSQLSIHYVLGSDLNFMAWGRPFKMVTELFYKDLRKITPYTIDNVKIQYYPEFEAKGYAAGLDLKINGEFVPGTESWFCLSLLQTKQKIESLSSKWIRRPSDQLVNASLYFQDYMPRYDRIRMNLTMAFGSKLPTGKTGAALTESDDYSIPSYYRIDIGFLWEVLKNDNNERQNKAVKEFLIGLEVYNLIDNLNTVSYMWVEDVSGGFYSVPNYLTSRLLNLKVSAKF